MVRAPTTTVDLAVLVPEAGLGTLVVHIPLYRADGGLCPLCPPPAGPGSGSGFRKKPKRMGPVHYKQIEKVRIYRYHLQTKQVLAHGTRYNDLNPGGTHRCA